MSTVHKLKCDAIFYDAIADGRKVFEIRKNDRFYQAGDIVELQRGTYDHARHCGDPFVADADTPPIQRRITYALTDEFPGLTRGYCALGLEPVAAEKPEASRGLGMTVAERQIDAVRMAERLAEEIERERVKVTHKGRSHYGIDLPAGTETVRIDVPNGCSVVKLVARGGAV